MNNNLVKTNNKKITKSFNSFKIKRLQIVVEIFFTRSRIGICISVSKTVKRLIKDDVTSEKTKKFRLTS